MRIALSDFRTFKNTGLIPVKRVNLLVGENSSGKTSFIAAARFVFDLFSSERVASFNSEPFFLGSFKDIAHLRGGRAGRAKQFGIGIEIDVPRSATQRRRRGLAISDLFITDSGAVKEQNTVSVEFRFVETKSQPSMKFLRIEAAGVHLKIEFERNDILISDEKGASLRTRNMFRSRVGVPIFLEISYLHYILRDIAFGIDEDTRRLKKMDRELIGKVQQVGNLISRVVGEVSLDTIASSPVRTEPQRVYQISERESQNTANLSAYELAQMSAFEARDWANTKRRLEEFGVSSGLFREIDIRHLSAHKDGPFQIVLKIGRQKSNIIDVGYGVSQALPLVFDMIRNEKPSVFFIQQPEVHLHPRAQVELASLLLRIAHLRGHILFVETHSDYIVDRFRMDVRDGKEYGDDEVGLLFFQRGELESSISPIEMSENGELCDPPVTYREFFLKEQMKSMGIKFENNN